jgi:hypothetical protein
MGKYLKIGDIFEVNLGDNTKGYVQYIADDMTQLNSRVVRAFKKRYSHGSNPTIDEITSDEVEFYVHVYDIKPGEKEGILKKIGKSQDVGDIKKVLFRSSSDSGVITASSANQVSKNWYIWRIGKETKDVRPNNKLLSQSHLGSVMPVEDVIIQMRTGKSEFFSPKYEGEE